MSIEAKRLQTWYTENTETNSQTSEHLNSPVAEETFRNKGPVFVIQQKGEKDKITGDKRYRKHRSEDSGWGQKYFWEEQAWK